jgi:Fringe-like
MSIIRHRSSDRLSGLLQESDEDDNINSEVGPATIASPISNQLKVSISAPNIATSTKSATASVTSTAANIKKTNANLKYTTLQFSSAYRVLVILGALAILHIKLSSTNNLFITDRILKTGDTSSLTAVTSSSSSISEISGDEKDESPISVDIISVGSITKLDFQTAQEQTFRTHPSVRNFFRITELNDTDSTCHTDLTPSNLQKIIKYCKSPSHRKHISDTSWMLRKLVYHPKNHTGWMCAQKRPIDGLYIALQQYVNKVSRIPNYMLIIDDDTYVNMNSLMSILQQNHTDTTTATTNSHLMHTPQLVTGCRFNYPQREHFLFPFGGFGTIMSRTVIRNLIQPIHCKSDSKNEYTGFGFVRAACWRLQQNLMGELEYFRDGMSIGDLMYVYAKQLSFTEVDSWKNGQGFCFHSDHALGYFFGYYHVSVPDEQFTLALHNTSLYDKMRFDYGYVTLAGPPGGCKHFKNRCTVKSSICHYIPPQQMHNLFRKGNNEIQQQ